MQKKTRSLSFLSLFVSALLSFGICFASRAKASDRRISVAACTVGGFSTTCPFIDETAFLASAVTVLNANYGTAGSYSARACVNFWNTTGSACGTAGSSGGTGQVTIPTSSIWSTANTNHFKYISVDANSSFQGIFAHRP